MTSIKINNPFNAQAYYEETVTSTMDISRRLAAQGAPHGTVITADFQEAGRGRILNRSWEMERGVNLPFTILLRYPRTENIPSAITLRAGLAAAAAIEDFAPKLQGIVKIKWPNDVMIGSKKAAGILCEADGSIVHLGIGINVSQKTFPLHLREKATSIALSLQKDIEPQDRFMLLEKILMQLYCELEKKDAAATWKLRMEQRLFKKDEQVVFIHGAADSGREVKGRLAGVGCAGEILIIPDGEINALSFFSGELVLPHTRRC